MPYPVVIGGIDCAVESQSESWPESGPEATVTFKVPWAAHYVVAQNLMGMATRSTSGAVVRTPPFRYPRSGLIDLRCKSLGTIEPRGNQRQVSTDGLFDYTWAFITANFGILRYQIDPGDPAIGHRDISGLAYTQTRIRTNAEIFTPPGGSYFTVYDEKPVPQSSLAIIRPHAEITMTRLMMPYVPVGQSMAFLQSVNAGPIKIGNRIFPRGTLMYAGMEDEDAGDPLGRMLFNIHYTLLGNDNVEWNQVFKEDDWRLINSKADGTGDPPFLYVNFDNESLPQLLSGFPA